MQIEILVIVSSILLYSLKYNRFNKLKKNYENNNIYNLNKIVIVK